MATPRTVAELEQVLFSAFPKHDAESWDNPGLSVGDRAATIGKIAVNLDQSVTAVQKAAENGCNVLVTHHPPYIKTGPDEFGPSAQAVTAGPGRMIYEAARLGVNVIAMHTNADRAVAVREKFAQLMGCACEGNFEFLMDRSRSADETGFGALLRPDWEATPTLERVADLCVRSFGGAPRVWGDPERVIDHIAFLNGSWNDPELYDICIANGIDCMIVGETRYHFCVDAQPHLSVIELGHDKSELPIVDVLKDALVSSGVSSDDIVELHCSDDNWWSPKTEG